VYIFKRVQNLAFFSNEILVQKNFISKGGGLIRPWISLINMADKQSTYRQNLSVFVPFFVDHMLHGAYDTKRCEIFVFDQKLSSNQLGLQIGSKQKINE